MYLNRLRCARLPPTRSGAFQTKGGGQGQILEEPLEAPDDRGADTAAEELAEEL